MSDRTTYRTLLPKTMPSQNGIDNITVCKQCLEKDDSAIHILCICEAIAYLTFHHLGHYFMKLDDCHDSTLFNVWN